MAGVGVRVGVAAAAGGSSAAVATGSAVAGGGCGGGCAAGGGGGRARRRGRGESALHVFQGGVLGAIKPGLTLIASFRFKN